MTQQPVEANRLMTAEELAQMPDDGQRYQLIEGRLVRMPPAGGGHDDVAARLAGPLITWVSTRNLGYVTLSQSGYKVKLPDAVEQVLVPDLAFVSTLRAPKPNSPEWFKFWELAPDLVVEVVSPSEHKPEMRRVARRWLTAGVRLLWMIWPTARQVEVWRPGSHLPTTTLGIAETLDGLDVLPGFTFPVAGLFR